MYFYNNDDLACGDISGNVMSLLSKDNFKSLTKIPCNGCFYCLFEESNIFDAYNLVLPATKLSKSCYEYIFDRCPNLVYSPKKLPAATLDE
ncbi:MAG: hypothetical protein MJ219_00605 [Mycoplasmoidaceae bacterium]|nr:hypothetical protein [Mycoplasmoidaceae bacterium]